MEIKYFTQNISLRGEIKDFLEEKINKLSRFSKRIEKINVDLSYNPGHTKDKILRLEINIEMKNKILRAVVRAPDLQAAVDAAEKKLRKQLERYKGFGLSKRRTTARLIRTKKSI